MNGHNSGNWKLPVLQAHLFSSNAMTNEGPLVSRLWQQGPVRLLSAFETEAKTDTFISNC